MYLRICNISLGLMLRECQFYFFPFIESRVYMKKLFEMFTEENPDKS